MSSKRCRSWWIRKLHLFKKRNKTSLVRCGDAGRRTDDMEDDHLTQLSCKCVKYMHCIDEHMEITLYVNNWPVLQDQIHLEWKVKRKRTKAGVITTRWMEGWCREGVEEDGEMENWTFICSETACFYLWIIYTIELQVGYFQRPHELLRTPSLIILVCSPSILPSLEKKIWPE